jgi:hypothetical protein
MSYEALGVLHKKYDTEKKTETFQAREFVIEQDDRGYKNFVKFQLTQDRCGIIDDINEGTMIKVHFDLRGREWNDKYFTNLNAWRVEIPTATQPNQVPGGADSGFPTSEPPAANQSTEDNDFDDLPF